MLGVPEVARLLGCSRTTIYRAIGGARLEARRLGSNGTLRVRPDAIEAFLKPVAPADQHTKETRTDDC